MVQSKLINIFLLFSISILISLYCKKPDKYSYDGKIDFSEHTWLKDKKIFLDPGHGGKGTSDRFRIGPGGITEEEINLRVGIILNDMLLKSGALVKMSRESDIDIELDDRIRMAEEYAPDILVSIHHNGSPRRDDNINYPTVFIWGSKDIRPASYDLAVLLKNEFHEIMEERGEIISDFTVFHETGTRILRRTRNLCPGVIGEAGFFSHAGHAVKLNDPEYNRIEAEAYFNSISKFFKNGSPGAEVLFSCRIYNNGFLSNMIKEKKPDIAIKFKDINNIKIRPETLDVTLDGIGVSTKKVSDNIYLIDYGKTLYPGGHRLRFYYKNSLNRSSMIFTAPFTVEIKQGDYSRLRNNGMLLIKERESAREGIKMLISALSMGLTDPGADKLIYEIANGFNLIGDRPNSMYYFEKIYYFHPESGYRERLKPEIYKYNSYRFPVEHHGKKVALRGNRRI